MHGLVCKIFHRSDMLSLLHKHTYDFCAVSDRSAAKKVENQFQQRTVKKFQQYIDLYTYDDATLYNKYFRSNFRSNLRSQEWATFSHGL